MGILLPRVESPEVLTRAASSTFFPPAGTRGYGFTQHNVDYEPVTIPQIIQHTNDNTMLVFQIETQTALDARDELISVPGVDAVMVGPADLSISLGIPGQFEHPKLFDAIEKIIESCHKHNVAPGIHIRALPLGQVLARPRHAPSEHGRRCVVSVR